MGIVLVRLGLIEESSSIDLGYPSYEVTDCITMEMQFPKD